MGSSKKDYFILTWHFTEKNEFDNTFESFGTKVLWNGVYREIVQTHSETFFKPILRDCDAFINLVIKGVGWMGSLSQDVIRLLNVHLNGLYVPVLYKWYWSLSASTVDIQYSKIHNPPGPWPFNAFFHLLAQPRIFFSSLSSQLS